MLKNDSIEEHEHGEEYNKRERVYGDTERWDEKVEENLP